MEPYTGMRAHATLRSRKTFKPSLLHARKVWNIQTHGWRRKPTLRQITHPWWHEHVNNIICSASGRDASGFVFAVCLSRLWVTTHGTVKLTSRGRRRWRSRVRDNKDQTMNWDVEGKSGEILFGTKANSGIILTLNSPPLAAFPPGSSTDSFFELISPFERKELLTPQRTEPFLKLFKHQRAWKLKASKPKTGVRRLLFKHLTKQQTICLIRTGLLETNRLRSPNSPGLGLG